MNNLLNVIGHGGHSKVITDIAKRNGYKNIRYFDDKYLTISKNYSSKENLYSIDDFFKMDENKKHDVFIAIGDNVHRNKIYKKLTNKYSYNFPTLIDPSCVYSQSSIIEEGVAIMPGVIINSNSHISKFCVINTKSSIDHDVSLGSFSHIAPGSTVCGNVKIDSLCYLGANCVVINNITIEKNVHIYAGTIITKNLLRNRNYYFKEYKVINYEKK